MDARSSGYGRAPTVAESPDDARGTVREPSRGVRLLERLGALFGPGADEPGQVVAARRGALLGYTAGSIALGLALLVWTTVAVPINDTIDPGLGGTALAGPLGGTVLWILFGFLGSLRVLRAPGGAGFLTFHLPFIGAAMVLGGPTAGAWVAFLSTLERRELEQQPWYGLLANHAVMVIAAVVGGLVAQGGAALLTTSAEPALGMTAAAVSGTVVLAVVTTAMAAGTVLLRDELSARAFLEVMAGRIGRVTALEVAIAWVLVVAYIEVGWWAPAVIGGLILLVWDNHPMPEPDALTGLLAPAGFTRRLEAGLGRLRRGLVPGATLFGMDLDYFKTVNDRYGHEVGNEVLAQVGSRLRAQARRPADFAGRLGGDEFALFLPGLDDAVVAMRRAAEVAAALTAPIATSVGPVTIGVSIGVVVLQSWGGVPSTGTVQRHADTAMFQAKRAGGGAHLHDAREAAPFDDGWAEERR